MSNLNQIDVPIAVEHRSKLDLSCSHVTTMGFMTTQPVNYRHMIKSERLSVNVDAVVRPAPIEVPVFGNLKQNIRAFFVPYRLVFPNWDQFYNDVIGSNYEGSSLVSSPPLLNSNVLFTFFTDPQYGLSQAAADDAIEGDFSFGGHFYNYTYLGRFALKLFESLGYKVFFKSSKNFNYNALAILAYTKVYVDWYANSQYLNSQDVLTFEQLCKYNDPTGHLTLSADHLFAILGLLKNVVYDNEDYYVNAWDNPVSPNSGQFTAFGFSDPTSSNGAYVVTNGLGSPEMTASTSLIGTTYIHDALKKLTDFQKRHALAGARSIDRVLAQYGIVTDSLKQQRSIYVGNQVVNIEIGSLYATADSTNGESVSTTGDYAGASFGQSKKTFDFTADEEGIFLFVASIVPDGHIVQGFDRNNLHIDKFDFFVPEFDSLGVQAIMKGEVYVSPNDSFGTDMDYQGTFGFSGRYGEYKRPKSFLTGDISLPVFYKGGSAWHLYRLFSDLRWPDQTDGLVHSLAFTRGIDADQYNRIFQYVGSGYDQFYCFLRFQMVAYSPCKPLFETYEFESNAKQVPTENGNKVN